MIAWGTFNWRFYLIRHEIQELLFILYKINYTRLNLLHIV